MLGRELEKLQNNFHSSALSVAQNKQPQLVSNAYNDSLAFIGEYIYNFPNPQDLNGIFFDDQREKLASNVELR